MKRLLYITVISILIGNTIMKGQNIQQVIDEVRKNLAPDKRTAIFDISFEQSSDKLILKGEVSDKECKKELIRQIQNLKGINLIDSIEVLPAAKLGNKIYALVNLSVCNIRSKPEHSAELATQALMGTPLKIYNEAGGGYLVQTPDDYLGWVDDDGISLKTSKEMMAWLNSEKVIYTDFFGFIYSDKDFSVSISDAVGGNIFEKINKSDNYFEVKLPDGRIGFVKINEAKEFTQWFSNLSFKADDIIDVGKKMLGFPYLWGGTSFKGIDCSGYMKTIFFLNGLILPRDANQQALIGEEILFDKEFSNLKPGDLIFFGRRGNQVRPERITHVGIYIGDKKFLHSSGRVRLDSFDKDDPNYNEYRLKTIVRIKRLLENKDLLEKLKIINNKFYTEEFYK